MLPESPGIFVAFKAHQIAINKNEFGRRSRSIIPKAGRVKPPVISRQNNMQRWYSDRWLRLAYPYLLTYTNVRFHDIHLLRTVYSPITEKLLVCSIPPP